MGLSVLAANPALFPNALLVDDHVDMGWLPSVSEKKPIIRLHLWLETEQGLFFGLGRALLLQKVAQHGSLRKAAHELGMSYRAAWGKIRKSEEILGLKLITQGSSKRDGCQLTESGRLLMENYLLWYDTVEREAMRQAEALLPWDVKAYPSNDG